MYIPSHITNTVKIKERITEEQKWTTVGVSSNQDNYNIKQAMEKEIYLQVHIYNINI